VGHEVWGTCSVKDHTRPHAFLRELLLFDKLVVPVPATDEERARWRRPKSENPSETWDPDRLDELLGVLGTQHSPGHNGARLVWTSPWDEERWQAQRGQIAELVTFDAFQTTRIILAMGEDIPAVVEAVAAYSSEQDWRNDVQPEAGRPADVTAAQALVALPREFLVPPAEDGDAVDTLKEVVELASNPDFVAARTEYHAWLRGFVEPLRSGAEGLAEVALDAASLELAQQRFRDLVERERAVVTADRRRKRWTKVEWASTVVGTGTSVGLALLEPLAGLAALPSLMQFAGWAAGKRTAPPAGRPLSGASLVVTAERQLKWAPQRLRS
jgi:hypothetical protein